MIFFQVDSFGGNLFWDKKNPGRILKTAKNKYLV